MKKKILVVSYDFCLESGGIQNTSYLLAEHFRDYFDVLTLCPKDGHAPDLEGVVTYISKYPNRSPLFIADIHKQLNIIHKEHQLDYVLLMHYKYGFGPYFFMKRHNVPYGILTYGEDVIKWRRDGAIGTLVWTLFYPFRSFILNHAVQLFSCTNYTKNLVSQISSNPNLAVINPPIGLLPKEEMITGVNKHSYILSIGRLEDRKGFQNVIQALPEVIKQYPFVKYVVAGSGDYLQTLKEYVNRLNLQNNVMFKGRVSEEEKCELLANCSLFAMPSYLIPHVTVEGFGLSLLEANVYGKFVLSSYSGGIPEAVMDGKTGFLVKENDIDSIASAIIRFYDDQFAYNPQECVEWAKKRHISRIAEEYYKEIISVLN